VTASLVALLLNSASGELDRDPDFLAPFLGLTLVDSEDLARDAADPLELSLQEGAPASGPLPSAAPLWATLLPSLSVELVHRQAHLLSGADILGLRSGTILLVEATFGLAGDDEHRGSENDRGAGGLKLSLAGFTAQGPVSAPATASGIPTIADVQKATETSALVRLEDLDGWRSRARASAWLPELGVSYQRNVGEIDTLGIQSNLGIDSHDVEDVARYGVRATWQLSQLVFSREEVAAAKAALEVQRDRQQLVAHVTELYFEWLRVRARAADSGGSERAPSALKLAEVTAQIDALTNGFLSGFLSRQLGEGAPP
jgi:hypothetical protein